MLKLMHKKLNKKGFTLAELLVVIAILAILIAIAVPVFTHMVAEANLRVNQANVHSVRSAAVAHILTHLGEDDDAVDNSGKSVGTKLNAYMGQDGHRWVATAMVDNNGNISDLRVYALKGEDGTGKIEHEGAVEGIGIVEPSGRRFYGDKGAADTTTFFKISDDVKDPFATVKPSMGKATTEDGASVYFVQAIVTDLKTD